MSDVSRAEISAVAVAECFRGDGEILASSFGTVAAVGAKLAKLTFEPDLLMTDGIACALENVMPVSGKPAEEPVAESWLPFRSIFDLLWSGKRHVMMIASQIDRFGNQNFACIGPHEKPKAQLLGMRGAPGNTICHRTSYWVPNHTKAVFVDQVDVVSGVGYDRAAQLDEHTTRFHDIHRVVSNLGVFDFETPDKRMRLRALHPGVSVEEVQEATGFELVIGDDVSESRMPTAEELRLIRDVIDPDDWRAREVRG